MKKNSAKNGRKKKPSLGSAVSSKSKTGSKVFRKIVKKIRKIAKKAPVRPRVAKNAGVQSLVLKEGFVKVAQGPAGGQAPQSARHELPPYYSENKLVLLVRDPWWLFSYWEVTPWREAEVTADVARAGSSRQKTVLRVYDITGASIESPNTLFDIEIHHLNSNWYIDVGQPDREWIAEIGYKTADGRFFMLVRSNSVRTPAFGISDVLDEEWMMPDDLYFKLLGIMGGFDATGGSHQIRKLVERYVRQSVSSENSSRLSPAKPV